ncbi:ABC transporter permease DevC [Chlorogloeopsis sp. ULAP02]|uniref:ABC transporter permease DevC n=1 Tax=Chlorogloeopsis sp. ULAP02 TaxID=3107926 RepID=UPI003134E21F
MKRRIPLAWLQLSREKNRLLVAMAGITFADILIFIQLGFQSALYDSNTRLQRSLQGDLVLISPNTRSMINMSSFPRRRLYQTMNFKGIKSADALYLDFAKWKNPRTHQFNTILTIGFNPEKSVFKLPEISQNLDKIRFSDTMLLDRGTRGVSQEIVTAITKNKTVFIEIEKRKIAINGLFKIGFSFAAEGHLITSDHNFLRLFATRRTVSEVNVGLITLQPGYEPKLMAVALQNNLPNDIKVLTMQEFIEFEKNYWAKNTAIGFIFSLGTFLGFIVGTVIVYQILYSDVTEHLPEYATLKAMGFRDIYLLGVVFQEALILAILGYVPGCAISFYLYTLTRNATNLPLFMPISRAVVVFVLTVLMCSISGAIAMNKIRSADPAEIF